MPWQTLADVLAAKTPPTPRQQEAIDQVCAVAASFVAGETTLTDVRRATTARQRNLAARHTPPQHPAFAALMATLDALIAQDPTAYVTKHGIVSHDDLVGASGKINRDEVTERIMFPVGKDAQGEAVYRPAKQAVEQVTYVRETEWWEE